MLTDEMLKRIAEAVGNSLPRWRSVGQDLLPGSADRVLEVNARHWIPALYYEVKELRGLREFIGAQQERLTNATRCIAQLEERLRIEEERRPKPNPAEPRARVMPDVKCANCGTKTSSGDLNGWFLSTFPFSESTRNSFLESTKLCPTCGARALLIREMGLPRPTGQTMKRRG
jgi:hypothetical protein